MPFRTRTAVSGVVLATAAVLLCSTAAVARPAAAPAPPGWSAAPAPGDGAAPGTPDRPYFYLEGAPGTVMSDRLSLSNPTGHTVTVRLRGSTPGAWLALASAEVKVPPRTRASVPFTVTVPRDAAPGECSGSLLATRGRGSGADGRVAVPVHLRVTGRPLSALTVEKVSVRRRGDAALIRYTLVNRGNTVLAPRLAVRADGLFGPVLRRAPRALPTTLRPGQGVDLTEKWADPPRLDAVDLRLTATAGGGSHGSATATYTTAPRGAVAGVMLLLVAGVAGVAGPVVVRRRRRARGAGEVPGARGAEGAGTAGGTAGDAPPPGGDRADAAGQLAGTGPGARS
ncbi:hypothetical protein RM550_19250 [Streptomyces sp. DSM 41527]|uniref:DUF916 domain-containing protein n=1 Tax=Streptomyces mooreae TaxID=3075523 RepID=A0ABU2TA80_9ACTN|nr:hypothetical protein [Streptomyces sp. DSM 41527]MDT0457845.1 hypothetical protein [Streptomyces sp. DSM 41527]